MRASSLLAVAALGAMVAVVGGALAAIGDHAPSTPHATAQPELGQPATQAQEPAMYRMALPGLKSDKPSPDPPLPTPAATSPTSAEGLRIWAYGDSTSWFVTQEFTRLLVLEGAINTRIVPSAAADEVSRRGIGLTAGSVDIPAYVASEMAAQNPDVVVLMFGANDAVGGIDPVSFRAQVGALMDQLQRPGRIVLWVGQPVMTRPDLVPHIGPLNALYKEEADKRTWVRYVDAYAITVGRPLAADGVHPTAASGGLIALEAIRVLFEPGEQ